jgi:hypothetical protein
MTLLDGQKEDGLVVADHLELRLGGREKEFPGAGCSAKLGGRHVGTVRANASTRCDRS